MQSDDFLGRSITSRLESERVLVIDLGASLRERFRTDHEALFHPKDGHLNATGHRRVAEILASRISDESIE